MSTSILSQCGEYQKNLSSAAEKILEIKKNNGETITEYDVQLVESDLYKAFVQIRDNCNDSVLLSAAIQNLEMAVSAGEINVEKIANTVFQKTVIEQRGNFTQTTIDTNNTGKTIATTIITGAVLSDIVDAYDQLYNGETQEIREAAGNIIALDKTRELTRDFRFKNRGTPADRATLIGYARAIASGDATEIQKSIDEAKKFGLDNLLNGNGEFNVEAVQRALMKSFEGLNKEKQEKYGTVEKMLAEAKAINQKCGARKVAEVEKSKESTKGKDDFGHKIKSAKTPEEKQDLIQDKVKADRVKSILKVIVSVAKSEHTVPVTKYMEELYALDSNIAKAVLPEVAERVDKPFRKDEISSFLEDKAKQEKTATPTAPSKSVKKEFEDSDRIR